MMLIPFAAAPGVRRLAGTPVAGAAVTSQDESLAVDEKQEQHARADEKRRRRRELHEEHAGLLAVVPSSADRINSAERGIERGSRTFERNANRAHGAEAIQARSASFRRALRESRSAAAPATPGNETSTESGPRQAPAELAPVPGAAHSGAETRATSPQHAFVPSGPPAAGPAASPESSLPAGLPAAGTAQRALPAQTDATQRASLPRPPGLAATALTPTAGANPAPNTAPRETPAANGRPVSAVVSRSGQRFALAPARKPQAAAPGGESESAENVARVVRLARSMRDANHTRATLRLDPPELGSLRLQMDLQRDVLTLRITTDSTAAREMLEREVDELRQALGESGIQLARVEFRDPASPPDAPREHTGGGGAHDGGSGATSDEPRQQRDPSLQPEAAAADAASNHVPATESLVNLLA